MVFKMVFNIAFVRPAVVDIAVAAGSVQGKCTSRNICPFQEQGTIQFYVKPKARLVFYSLACLNLPRSISPRRQRYFKHVCALNFNNVEKFSYLYKLEIRHYISPYDYGSNQHAKTCMSPCVIMPYSFTKFNSLYVLSISSSLLSPTC